MTIWLLISLQHQKFSQKKYITKQSKSSSETDAEDLVCTICICGHLLNEKRYSWYRACYYNRAAVNTGFLEKHGAPLSTMRIFHVSLSVPLNALKPPKQIASCVCPYSPKSSFILSTKVLCLLKLLFIQVLYWSYKPSTGSVTCTLP